MNSRRSTPATALLDARRLTLSGALLAACFLLHLPLLGSHFVAVAGAQEEPMPASSSVASSEASPERLWGLWSEHRFVEDWSPAYRHADLLEDLDALKTAHPQVQVEIAGHSYEGRPIHRIRVGKGLWRILLWSQMHGDEPSATPALLDLVHYLLSDPDSPWAPIVERFTLDIVPMLNPDGAEHGTRRNAQSIDINRDALNLASPEGRILKELRDRYKPLVGFNLHDQGRRKEVGETDVLATAAVLAVAGDEAKTVTGLRLRAMRLCVAIAEALETRYPGGVARYDDSFNSRAFGDNITAWGTPVVLLESGGLPLGEPVENLVRMNFVALLHALRLLSVDDAHAVNAKRYEDIPYNRNGPWVDVLLREVDILQTEGRDPYRADLAFNVERSTRAQEVDLNEWLRRDARQARSWIREVGDGRELEGTEEFDFRGRLVVPTFEVMLSGWKAGTELSRPTSEGTGLDLLARWGVGVVHWEVPPKRIRQATSLVENWRSDGRPLVFVRAAGTPASRTWVQLAALPSGEPPAALSALSQGLGAATVAALWQQPDNALPPLRPSAPASLLVLSSPPSVGAELAEREVEAIWIDGVRTR